MKNLGLDPAENILERLALNTKIGKRLLRKNPFLVCEIFGHSNKQMWEASDRYWRIMDSVTPESADRASLAALEKAEADFLMWETAREIRAEALGLMRPRGLDQLTDFGKELVRKYFPEWIPELGDKKPVRIAY